MFSCAAVIALRFSPSRRPEATLKKLAAAGHGTKAIKQNFGR